MVEQLNLELGDARLEIPWGGLSPRELTRCGKLFSFEASPTGGPIQVDPAQLTLFLKGSPSWHVDTAARARDL